MSTKQVVKATDKKTVKKTPSIQKKTVKVAKKDVSDDDASDVDNVDFGMDDVEVEPPAKHGKANAKIEKSAKGGLKDLNKINDDPEGYARGVTVERLVTILQKMSDHYYAEARPLVDDEVYDVMLDVLRERDPDNAYLFQTGVEKTTDKDVELPFKMPSLNKIKPGEKAFDRWFKSYKGPYMIMDKLDGISVQVYKDDEGNVDLFTKKQTGMGTSKKHLLKYLVDKKVLAKLPKGTAVRGEVVISQEDFKAVQELDPNLKNPRSAMAGLVNTDKIDTRIAEKAQYVTYAVFSPRYKIADQLTKLKAWGFKTVWNREMDADELMGNDEEEDDDDEEEGEEGAGARDSKMKAFEEKLKSMLAERRETSEFLIDGLVITDGGKIYEHSDSEPKHSMAFKMNSTTGMKDATIEEVMWEPTMYGYLQPVIRIKPVVLSGNTTVTYVTAHNAKYVQDNKLGKGAIIKIVRSGEVIPYIVSVTKPAKVASMPDMEYEWNDTNVEIIVVDPSDEVLRSIRIKQNLHFFRKLGVKFLSEGIITKMYDAGYETITSIVAAASSKDRDPYKIAGLGEKMITKIYDQIDKAFSRVKLPELMSGSLKFGRGLGVRKIREIIKKYPTILDMKDDDEDEIAEKILTVSGFSQVLAGKFSKNLKQFGEFLDELKENCDYNLDFKPEKKVVKPKDTKSKKKAKDADEDDENNEENEDTVDASADGVDMSNEVVVMTGFRSDKITEFIENHGGRVSSGVSGTTTLVLYVGDKLSSKLQKASEKGITIMKREDFEKKYNL
ncbi:NAD-dependent DNA ligase [Yasminevirus sp. GU-2018]|uniref:NAD-dependent DNA ligase n=1 Tax=Yasminevirus sp. GU-2018 TaxID=2420051 RepID=A0A5K0U8G9_9VIRU|nr:NAD-dependent DNA ligase [Yasminevirus sp. GU-2018]